MYRQLQSFAQSNASQLIANLTIVRLGRQVTDLEGMALILDANKDECSLKFVEYTSQGRVSTSGWAYNQYGITFDLIPESVGTVSWRQVDHVLIWLRSWELNVARRFIDYSLIRKAPYGQYTVGARKVASARYAQMNGSSIDSSASSPAETDFASA